MPTNAEYLAIAKANFAQQLAELSVRPKPNYTVDGKQYSFQDYLKFLMDSMNAIDVAIQSEEGPAEVVIQGCT